MSWLQRATGELGARHVLGEINSLIVINHLTPELNPSAQRCLTRSFYWAIFLLEPYISLIYAWKTNKNTNYSTYLVLCEDPPTWIIPPDATPHEPATICYTNGYLSSYVTPDDGQGMAETCRVSRIKTMKQWHHVGYLYILKHDARNHEPKTLDCSYWYNNLSF
jgi:hypothetical protein